MQEFTKHRLLVIILASLLVGLMVACSADTSPLVGGEDSNGASQSQTEADAVLSVAQTSQDVEEEEDDSSSDDASDNVAAAPQQVDACLNCHSDKEQLIATAAPVVEVEEESEGEG